MCSPSRGLREAFLKTPMWERIKAEEKAARGEGALASVLDGVPRRCLR